MYQQYTSCMCWSVHDISSPMVHDSGRGVLLQIVQKQVGQVERTKVIDAKLDLKVLLCSVIRGHEHPSVVEQSMQGQVAFVEISCETAN